MIRLGLSKGARAPKTTSLKWIDSFETGDAKIDSWHRKLVDSCNHLLNLLAEEAAWPLIVDRSRALVVDCIEHFQFEDVLLESIKFPRRDAHRAEHRRMEQELHKLLAVIEAVDGSRQEHRGLPASLGPAIVDLMIRHDLDFRSHLLHHRGR